MRRDPPRRSPRRRSRHPRRRAGSGARSRTASPGSSSSRPSGRPRSRSSVSARRGARGAVETGVSHREPSSVGGVGDGKRGARAGETRRSGARPARPAAPLGEARSGEVRGRGRGGGDAPRDRPRGVRKAERAVDVRARRARGPDVGRTHHDATVGKEGGRGEGEGERAPPDLRTSRAGFRGWVRQERARVGRAAAATARSNARAGRPPRRDICRQMRERGALGEEKNVERGRFVEGGSRASRRAVATDGRAHLRRIADAGGRFAGDRARLEGARDRLSARARGSIRLVQVSIIINIVNFSGPNAIDELRLTRQRF